MMISSLINFILSLDQEIAQKLFFYENKTLQINFIPLNISVFLNIQKNKITFSRKSSFVSNAVIQGTPLDLTMLMFSDQTVLPKTVSISGDISFIQDFRQVFQDLNIDKEEVLSKITGDFAAYGIYKGLNFMQQCYVKTAESFSRNLKEYIEEEVRWIVSRAEAEDFYKNVDTLMHDADRLYARFELLALAHHLPL